MALCALSPRNDCSHPVGVTNAGVSARVSICVSSSRAFAPVCTGAVRGVREYDRVLCLKARPARREGVQPRHVAATPVRAVAIDEAAAREELEDIVSRLQAFPLKRLAAAHEVAHPLLALGGNPYRREFPGAIQACQVDGVALVVFSLDTIAQMVRAPFLFTLTFAYFISGEAHAENAGRAVHPGSGIAGAEVLDRVAYAGALSAETVTQGGQSAACPPSSQRGSLLDGGHVARAPLPTLRHHVVTSLTSSPAGNH